MTLLLWPSSACFQPPLVASQSRIVLSYETEVRALPSGEEDTATAMALKYLQTRIPVLSNAFKILYG
jgi:hypothetical protein